VSAAVVGAQPSRPHRGCAGDAAGDVPPAPRPRPACASSGSPTQDIEAYLASGEWRGKAGGYAAQGIAGTFLVKIVGSYSNIIGLPLYETLTLLGGEGFPVHFGWLNAM